MKNSQLIKRNNISSGYSKVYPLAYIQGITDGDTGVALKSILETINHLYIPYQGSIKCTRLALPDDYRREGVVITYNTNEEVITERYIGNIKDTSSDLFAEDLNWEVIPSIKCIMDNASKVINLPDEEDLTQECHVLKFKDRIYNSCNSSGLGYKILRKNFENGDNLLLQGMVDMCNTIYEIRYDYDLNGAVINIPEGCVLLFKGGHFNNGTISCNGTNIIGINKFEDGGDAAFTGTFNTGLVMAMDNTIKWFNGTEWIEIEGTGGSIEDLTARVVEVTSTATANAEATVVGTEIQFKFNLPKGDKGDKGDTGPEGPQGPKGADGKDGTNGTIEGFTATALASEADEVSADVQVNGTNLSFQFGLPKGPQGPQGPAGKDGTDGSDGITPNYKTYVYKKADSKPAKPEGTDLIPEGWSDYPDSEGQWWQCIGSVNGETNLVTEWSEVLPVNGKDGQAQDGTHVEMRFAASASRTVAPSLTNTERNPEGWTVQPPTVAENDFLWMIMATINPNNTLNGTWSVPVCISGEQGPQGPQGEPGPQGPAGDVAVSTQTFVIFKSTGTSTIRPATPTGGHWDFASNTFTPPTGWGTEDELEGIVWMSTGIFMSDTGNIAGEWSTPVRITGANGANGTDGTSIEFIYKLTATSLEPPYLDVTDSPNTNEYVPSGWTDSPTGISVEMQCEWVATRKKTDAGTWSNWTSPVIWSRWGVNGQDGDGVEYIFLLNNGAEVNNPTPENTNTDQYQERGDYEGVEYIPAGWTDNPQGVSETYQYEWVSQRKYRNGSWGAFSDPAIWAKWSKDGNDGTSGLSLRTMYAVSSYDEAPAVVEDNVNPGSIWGIVFPDYDEATEAVWCIQAYFNYKNELATTEEGAPYEGWQGPWIVTGRPGTNGTPPNYKTYVYKKSDTKPEKPTGTDKVPSGWLDYPNSSDGQWWQSIGSVNGVTDMVTEWSEVIPVNGKDGIAQDGKFTEFRFKSSRAANPSVEKTAREPDGWTTTAPDIVGSQSLYMIWAVINPDNTLNGTWSDPVKISGEQGPQGETGPAGPQGPTGSQGVSGIPGVSIEVQYAFGTEEEVVGGWGTVIPSTNDTYPYIWCRQGRRVYESAEDTEGTVTWGNPFILNGVNGLNGTDGKKGQLVYPAGVYSNTTSYTTDDYKAPYVLDPNDGNFYVLNAVMTWLGTEQDNRTPAQDYAANNGKYWLKFDAFEAVYAKIGIIANGLIGSAVFNGDWMFSQQGTDTAGDYSDNYETFDGDPIEGVFRPNIAINFRTGKTYLNDLIARGNIMEVPTYIDASSLPQAPASTTTKYLELDEANPNHKSDVFGKYLMIDCSSLFEGTVYNSLYINLPKDPKYQGKTVKIGILEAASKYNEEFAIRLTVMMNYSYPSANTIIYTNKEWYQLQSGGAGTQEYNKQMVDLPGSGIYTITGIQTTKSPNETSWVITG